MLTRFVCLQFEVFVQFCALGSSVTVVAEALVWSYTLALVPTVACTYGNNDERRSDWKVKNTEVLADLM